MPIDAVVFDVNETLSDMTALASRFAEAGQPPEMLDSWFAGVLRDGFALAAAGDFRPFGQIAAGNLRGTLTAEQIDSLLTGFRELDAHPDVPEGLRLLAEAGYRLITLTNGAAALSESMFARAGVLGLLESRLSVEDAVTWKPAPASYRHAADACGLPLDRMAMVAVHPWDVHGAQRVGMFGVWVNRHGAVYPDYLPAPDAVVTDLRDLAAVLT